MSGEKRHIAVFSLAYDPFEGGAEIAVREIMARSPEATFTVFTHRFEREWPVEETMKNVRIVRLGEERRGASAASRYGRTSEKIRYVFVAFRSARKFHAREPFTALWGIMASYGGIAALLMKLRHPRLPFLLSLQEGDAEEHILRRVGIFYPFWRLIFRRADAVQAISTYLADFAKRHGATRPVAVVPNGVDINKFQIPKSKLQTNSKFQNPNTKTIITTSRLVRKNGIDLLIRACATLEKREAGNWKLEIVGDGPERENLERLARELGVADRVRFVGAVPHSGIPEKLRGADIFARASRSEGLGSSFLEAMAAGLPVIGTSVGGIPDFLKDQETGLFAKVDDPRDLAEKITLLMRDTVLRRKLAERGRALVVERYGWDRIAGAMEKLFEALPRRRMLIATGIFPPDAGGAATWSAFAASELPARGVEVAIVTYGEQHGMPRVSATSRKLPKGIRHAVYFARLLARALRNDVVCAADSSFGAATVAAVAAFFARRKFLMRVTGDYAWEQGQQRFGVSDDMDAFQPRRYGFVVQMLRACQTFAARRAAQIIVPSTYLEGIVQGWGIPSARVVVVPNPVEAPVGIRKAEARRALGLSGYVAFSAGRLVSWKGFRALVEVAAALRERHHGFMLLIAGDGPERETLAREIEARHAEGYVRLLGRLPRQELMKHLAAADCFILNSAYEGFSHQLGEALAAGLPVIASASGGNPELVRNGENGLLAPYNDIPAIRRALERLITDSPLRKRLAEEAPASVAQFAPETVMEQIAVLL